MSLPLFGMSSLVQPAYAGAIQPLSCEHPPAPQPTVPMPAGLSEVPINAPPFPPASSVSSGTSVGGPIPSPSCEYPPTPPPTVPMPPGLSQVPINSASFPPPPCPTPYQQTNWGSVSFHQTSVYVVPGAGNAPGIGIPGNFIYGSSGTTALRSPLVPGANFSMPYVPASPGMLPPMGSGYVPLPVTPGMIGSPTLVPWTNGTAGNSCSQPASQAVIPANQIDVQDNLISLPTSNYTAQPPGTWNSQGMRSSIPPSPSTPGEDPGMLRPPSFNNGSSGAQPGKNFESPAKVVSVGQDGQLPDSAPKTRTMQRGTTNDFGLSQKTQTAKTNFAYRMQVSTGSNNEPTLNFSNGSCWKGLPGSTTEDFGIGVKQLAAAGKLGSKEKPQTSYDNPREARYPGGQGSSGTLNQNSKGNHNPSSAPGFSLAQVTNDLYGVPMTNSSRNYTDGNGNQVSSVPITTIAPY